MKRKYLRIRGSLIATLAAAGLCSSGNAEWGSIRGNNRFNDEHRGRDEHRAEVRRDEHRREEHHPVQVVRHIDRDIEVDRQHAHFWSGFFAGMVVHALPHGHITIAVGGRPYFYYDGVYYQNSNDGYVVVAPPAGAFVSALPTGSVAITVGATTYFYGGGAYYVQQGTGFIVVPVPIGITVAALPPGATPVNVNGTLYYLAGGTYYLPVMQGGVAVYLTVRL